MHSIRQGIADGITDAWAISQRPNANGYTIDVYLAGKAKYVDFMKLDLSGRATPYHFSYFNAFDAVAVKRGLRGEPAGAQAVAPRRGQ